MNNLAIDFKEHIYNVDTDQLSSLQMIIEKQRKDLYDYAESLMKPLDKILVNHFIERLRCSDGLPMMGEYATYLLGDLFLIKSQILDCLAFPWLLTYEYCLLLDDLIDKSRSNWPLELLLSQILLESSITEYKRVLGENEQLWNAYDLYRREWMNGIIYEMDKSIDNKRQAKTGAIIQQGRKAAMVKFCATSIVFLDKNRLLTSDEEKGIDQLCAGIQLLDDLNDVFEDHSYGRLNVLLEDTYEWLNGNFFNCIQRIHPKDINDNQLITGLVHSGAIGRSWKVAAEQIDNGINLLTDIESRATKYFYSISEKCRESSSLIEEATRDKQELQDFFLTTQVKGENTKIINIKSVKRLEMWDKINDYINNGPKACN